MSQNTSMTFSTSRKTCGFRLAVPSSILSLSLDFEDVFGSNYRFADQKEVLLPPFVHASFYEGTLTKEEKEYRDNIILKHFTLIVYM